MAVGDEIEALGAAPVAATGASGSAPRCGGTAIALPAALHVKFTATLEGVTHRLALPEPVTAYVNADGVRRIAG